MQLLDGSSLYISNKTIISSFDITDELNCFFNKISSLGDRLDKEIEVILWIGGRE